ncbi:hypothetical protein HN911_13255 [Candidatus Bathyarchaeota archaeon]|jgi:hypothetical protein|nr:hypothetical protein [Candidatus Bathyarchaeota archaeon]MBT7912804.1 hypothetical protein [Candidatus Bathyarchaeota archaeon]
MLNFIRQSKNNYNRGMCGQAVAAAQSVLQAIDSASNCNNFQHHVSQLKYHAAQARKYFKRVTWDMLSDEILADSDIGLLEKNARELGSITEDEYEELNNMDIHEAEEGAISAVSWDITAPTECPTNSTEGPCKKCGTLTQSSCACADWLCETCSLGRHPEYNYIMCEDCRD